MKLATRTLPLVGEKSAPARAARGVTRTWLAAVGRGTWALLALALIGFTIFAHQMLYVAQPRDYTPNWHGAEWIRPLNVTSSVAYFHTTFTVDAPPQGAYLMVQGWQTYTLYVNGLYVEPYQIDTDFRNGAINLAHLYDLTPLLTTGQNRIALRVINLDDGLPAIRALIAVTQSGQTQYLPSDPSWHATTEPTVAYPANAGATLLWSGKAVSDAKWPLTAHYVNAKLPKGVLRVNPAAITAPFSAPWLASGVTPSTTTINSAGVYRTLRVGDASEAWLRIASTGTASVYIDGQ